MKAALVTMKVKAGRCEENFCYMKEKIEQAKEMGADLIIFPQNVVSGYLLGDVWLDEAWCRYVDSFNEKVTELSEEIAIVWGNIRYRNRRRFNAAFFAYQKKTAMRVKKHLQASYADDERYFEENAINAAITFQDMVLALNFQEELQLADLNINLDARPYTAERKRSYRGNVVYVNACGIQECDGRMLLMEGGSYYVKDGELQYHADHFQEEMYLIDTSTQEKAREKKPCLLKGLIMGIQEADRQFFGGKRAWQVLLQEGLDSAFVCALLAYALGKDRVSGYRGHKEARLSQAEQTARRLGLSIEEGDKEAFFKKAEANERVLVHGACRTRWLLKEETLPLEAFFVAGDLRMREIVRLADELNALFEKEVISSIARHRQRKEEEELLRQEEILSYLERGASADALFARYKTAAFASIQEQRFSLDEEKSEKELLEELLQLLERVEKRSFLAKRIFLEISVHEKSLKDAHHSKSIPQLSLRERWKSLLEK